MRIGQGGPLGQSPGEGRAPPGRSKVGWSMRAREWHRQGREREAPQGGRGVHSVCEEGMCGERGTLGKLQLVLGGAGEGVLCPGES